MERSMWESRVVRQRQVLRSFSSKHDSNAPTSLFFSSVYFTQAMWKKEDKSWQKKKNRKTSQYKEKVGGKR